MIILDIDIDLFLNKVARKRVDSCDRLDPEHFIPDDADFLRWFLEKGCHLTSDSPCQGSIHKHHDEVFRKVESLIDSGKLTPPFFWIHADAHDDLNNRADYLEPLHSGNFMLHLLVKGWIKEFLFIHHPSEPGLAYCETKPFRIEFLDHRAPCNQHPKNSEKWHLPRRPDFVFITHSPNFTPVTVDPLFELASNYVIPV